MTRPTGTNNRDRDRAPDEVPRHGNWVTWAIVLLGVMIVLVAASELWMWHPWR